MKKIVTTSFSIFAKLKWWLVLLLLVGGGIFLYQKQQQAKQPKLSFVAPVRQTITETVEAPGVVDAKEKAFLRFAAGGKLTYLGAKEGDAIKKHQTIARIDARDLQKRLESSLNTYSQQRNSWDQTLDDTKDRWISSKESRTVNTNQLSLDNTVIAVELQDIAISNTVMSSPIAGILVSAPTSVSGVVLAATDGFGVMNPSTMIFSAEIDESEIAKIKIGQKAIVSLDAYPDRKIETHVSFVGFRSINTSSGTAFAVEFPISAQDAATYRLGMNGDVKVALATQENALTVPLSATKERDSKFYVDVKTGPNKAEEREIAVGLQTDEIVEVTGGLQESDEVVLP